MIQKPMRDGQCTSTYVQGLTRTGEIRRDKHGHPVEDARRPEVLFGNAEAVTRMTVRDKQPFFSGVLTWSTEETRHLDKARVAAIGCDYLAKLMPGMEPGKDYAVLAVLHHEDKGKGSERFALHVVIPKVHLPTGKRLTPYLHRLDGRRMDAWQTAVNARETGFVDPHAPEVRRAMAHGGWKVPSEAKEVKKAVGELVQASAEAGEISDRTGIVALLKERGFEMKRETKRSLTVTHPNHPKPIRLEGELYELNGLERITARSSGRETGERRESDERVAAARDRLPGLVERKRAQLADRYGQRGARSGADRNERNGVEMLRADGAADRGPEPVPHRPDAGGAAGDGSGDQGATQQAVRGDLSVGAGSDSRRVDLDRLIADLANADESDDGRADAAAAATGPGGASAAPGGEPNAQGPGGGLNAASTHPDGPAAVERCGEILGDEPRRQGVGAPGQARDGAESTGRGALGAVPAAGDGPGNQFSSIQEINTNNHETNNTNARGLIRRLRRTLQSVGEKLAELGGGIADFAKAASRLGELHRRLSEALGGLHQATERTGSTAAELARRSEAAERRDRGGDSYADRLRQLRKFLAKRPLTTQSDSQQPQFRDGVLANRGHQLRARLAGRPELIPELSEQLKHMKTEIPTPEAETSTPELKFPFLVGPELDELDEFLASQLPQAETPGACGKPARLAVLAEADRWTARLVALHAQAPESANWLGCQQGIQALAEARHNYDFELHCATRAEDQARLDAWYSQAQEQAHARHLLQERQRADRRRAAERDASARSTVAGLQAATAAGPGGGDGVDAIVAAAGQGASVGLNLAMGGKGGSSPEEPALSPKPPKPLAPWEYDRMARNRAKYEPPFGVLAPTLDARKTRGIGGAVSRPHPYPYAQTPQPRQPEPEIPPEKKGREMGD
jgi:hypothetical protein